jgi:UDP-2,3-diacylglucosamine pyrophosphatase LpxH
MEIFRAAEITLKSLDDPIHLCFFGDVHMGAKGCDEERFRGVIERIAKDPRALAFDMGDSCDFIDAADKRWSPRDVASWVTVADLDDFGTTMAARYSEMVSPLRGKLVGRVLGNHEEKYIKGKGQDVHGLIASNLGCLELAYLNDCDILFRTASDEKRRLTIEVTHGKSAASTRAGRLNSLRKVMHDTTARLVVMGHVHAKDSEEWLRRDMSEFSRDLALRSQLGVLSGTFLQTYHAGRGGYGERALYSPASLGAACIEVRPRHMELSVHWL